MDPIRNAIERMRIAATVAERDCEEKLNLVEWKYSEGTADGLRRAIEILEEEVPGLLAVEESPVTKASAA
jgi:hypothetical protein